MEFFLYLTGALFWLVAVVPILIAYIWGCVVAYRRATKTRAIWDFFGSVPSVERDVKRWVNRCSRVRFTDEESRKIMQAALIFRGLRDRTKESEGK